MGKHWLAVFGIVSREDHEREARTQAAETEAKARQDELQIELERAKRLNELFAKVSTGGH